MKRFVVLVLVLVGCSKSSSTQSTTPITDPVPMREGTAAPATAPELTALLDAYEDVRAALAADDATALAPASMQLEAHAGTAVAKGTPATSPHLAQIQTHAKHLAGTAQDLEAARTAFGEVSRHVVALLVADKALAEGKHVFECPMVEGYRKWVQPTDRLENPYMGKRMLVCGGASRWE